MTKPCAVPKCKTGYKSVKEKCSVFKVPANIEQLKKWQAAIPGIVELKTTQYVCEKHFEKKFVLRKKIHRDLDGRIIAEASYVYPKLDTLAVPSIFQGDETHCIYGSSTESSDHINAEDDHTDPMFVEHNYCSSKRSSLMESDGVPVDDPRVDAQCTNTPICISAGPGVLKMDNDCPVMEFVYHPIEEPSSEHERKHSSPEREILAPLQVTSRELSERQQAQNHPAVHPSSETKNLSFSISSQVSIINCAHHTGKCLVDVPRPWAASELSSGGGGTIMFSLIVQKVDNCVKRAVLQKNVTLSIDKMLRYFVYTREIDVNGWNLAQTLDDAKVLPGILQRFQNLGMCNGLGMINVHHLSADSAFKDSVDGWRSNGCSLISKRKRCDKCIKLRKLVRQKEVRSERNAQLNRVSRASNPADQRKILILRKKNLRIRRQKNKARRRVELLRTHA